MPRIVGRIKQRIIIFSGRVYPTLSTPREKQTDTDCSSQATARETTMRVGKILGTVTLSRRHPSLEGASFRLVRPLTWEEACGAGDRRHDEQVVMDQLGSGVGSLVALSEGREASMPFYPDVKPIDGYVAAILDTFQIDQRMIDAIESGQWAVGSGQ